MVKRMRRRHKTINKCQLLLIIVLIIILVLVLGCFAIIDRAYNQSALEKILPPNEYSKVDKTDGDRNETMEADPDTENADTNDENASIDSDDVEWNFIERIEDDELINILLVGQDRRNGESRQRSDTMILCSINPKTGETSLVSFLRDLYVQIPGGYADNRLNATYRFGGFELLDATLTENFGISMKR